MSKALLSLLIVWFLAACAPLQAAPPTLKIGLVGPFEGLHRPLGYEVLFAVKLAIQERNATGGLQGYQIELVALNDFDEPAEAERQAKALVADPAVLGVVGHLAPTATEAALPIYQAAEVAVSVPWTIAEPDDESGRGVIRLAANQTESLARLAEAAKAQGVSQPFSLTTADVTAIPDQAQSLTLLTDGVTAGEIILALAQPQRHLPLFGGPEVGSPQLTQVAGSQATGLIFVSPGPNPVEVPAAAEFVRAYQALASFAPGPRAGLAYDATQVLLDAIEAALSETGRLPTRATVSAKLGQVQRAGLSGDIAFDRLGQRRDQPVWLYQIVDGSYPGKLIYP